MQPAVWVDPSYAVYPQFWGDPNHAVWANLATAIPCFLLCAWAQFSWYPGFLKVDPNAFPSTHSRHCRRLGRVAPLPFLGDLLAAVWLGWMIQKYLYVFTGGSPDRPEFYLAGMCASLTILGWSTTFLLIVPLHRRLEQGYDAGTLRTLIRMNSVRTAAWALKILGLLLFWRA